MPLEALLRRLEGILSGLGAILAENVALNLLERCIERKCSLNVALNENAARREPKRFENRLPEASRTENTISSKSIFSRVFMNFEVPGRILGA